MNKRIFAGLAVGAVLFASAFCHLCGKVEQNERDRANAVIMVAAAETTTTTTTTTTTKAPEKTVTVIATAYCACEKCCGKWAHNRPLDKNGNEIVYTASGARAYANHTIAVDTDVFPFGTVLEIGGIEYVAEDTGSAIVGNKIDIYFDDHDAAWDFGRQELVATIEG